MYGTRQHTPSTVVAQASASRAGYTDRGDNRVLDLPQGRAFVSLQTTLETQYADAGTSSSSSQGKTSTSSQERTADPVVLTGHRYGWAVLIDDSVRSKREQWYLDFAPGSFPYPAGILVEHNGQLYVIKCVGTSMLRVAGFREDEVEGEDGTAEEPPVGIEYTEAKPACREPVRVSRVCFEVSASCLPDTYRDRISRRQRTCWVETPEPSTIRPGYFLTRIGRTPAAMRAKNPVFLTEQEAAALVPVAQAPSPIIKVVPAFLLPEAIRRAIFPGIARPADLWGSAPGQPGVQDAEPTGLQPVVDTTVKVPIPEQLCHMGIRHLGLSPALEDRLRLAGITMVGSLLEMQEDSCNALSIGEDGMQEIRRRLQAVHALPSRAALVYEECYLHITDITSTDEQQDTWCMAYVSVFPDRLSGWRSGRVYTVWLLKQHVDLAMDWDCSLLSLDTHTLRVLVNEHARGQGAVAPPLRVPKRKRTDDEQGLSASQNLFIPREATAGLLGTLPSGEEERRYQERRANQIFGVLQEEWLALGREAALRERELRLRVGQQKEAFSLKQVAACIEQVTAWYARLRYKPRILGLCGIFVEDQVLREHTYIVRGKGRPTRKKTVRRTEPAPRLVGYHLVVGAPSWIVWPGDWVHKPCEERHSVEGQCVQSPVEQAQVDE